MNSSSPQGLSTGKTLLTLSLSQGPDLIIVLIPARRPHPPTPHLLEHSYLCSLGSLIKQLRDKPESASLAASTFGCYESCVHNKAAVGVIDLVGAKGPKSLRIKRNLELSVLINKCESRPELQTKNIVKVA